MLVNILITWASFAIAMFFATTFLSKMEIKGGIGSYVMVAGTYGLLLWATGWFFTLVMGTLSGGLLFVFSTLLRIIVGAIVLKLTDVMSDRLEVKGIGTALIAAIIIAVSGSVVERLLTDFLA